MNTFTRLTDDLSKCEKHIALTRQAAEDALSECEERVQMVAKRRQELLEEHQKRCEWASQTSERQIENVAAKAAQEIEEAVEGKRKAEERIKECEARIEKSERNARALENRVRQLYSMLDENQAHRDSKLSELWQATDDAVRDRMSSADALVKKTSILAWKSQEAGIESIRGMQEDLKDELGAVDQKSTSRSRFKDLYSLSLSRSGREMAEQDFQEAKNKHVRSWFGDWCDHTDRTSPQGLGAFGASRGVSPFVGANGRPRNFASTDPGPFKKELEVEGGTLGRTGDGPLALGARAAGLTAHDVLARVKDLPPHPPGTPRAMDSARDRAACARLKKKSPRRPYTAPE